MLRFEKSGQIWVQVTSSYEGPCGERNETWSIDSETETERNDALDIEYPKLEPLNDYQIAAIYLLEDAGYVRLNTKTDTVDPNLTETYLRISWDGYEYLDLLRDEGIWKKTKAAVKEEGGSLALEVIKSVATALGKKQIEDRTGLKL